VGPRTLYLAVAAENATYAGADVLLDALRTAKPHDLTVRYEALPEHHNTIFAVAALQAFRTVFASAIRIGWFADPWSVAQGGTGARLRQRLRNRFPGLF